jgi:uncharacterized protein YxeA
MNIQIKKYYENINNKNKWLLIVVGLILVISAFYYGVFYKNYLGISYFNKNISKSGQKSQSQEEQLKNIFNNYLVSSYDRNDSKKMISETEAFLENNKGKLDARSEALAEAMLGDSYFSLINDPVKGIGILKEIIKNEKYPFYYRALAVTIISDGYDYSPGPDFYVNNLFNDEYFKDMYKEQDISLAFFRLNSLSDSLSPNSVAKLRMAKYYAGELSDKTKSGDEKKKIFADCIVKMAEADRLLIDGMGKNKLGINPSQAGLAYRLEAETLARIYLSGISSEIKKETVINSFEKSMKTLETPPTDRYMKYFSFYTRYYYATFLASLNDPQYNPQIKSLLNPIYTDPNINQYQIYGFLQITKKSDPKLYPYYAKLKQLMGIDPEFGKFIENLQ